MEKLTDFEEKIYQFFLERREVSLSDVPKRMMGAIPKLNRMGFIEIVKKTASPWSKKKRKFIIAKHAI